MKIIIEKIFLLIFVFKSVYLSDSESDSASSSSEEEETKPKLNFEEIKKHFQLSKDEANSFKNSFKVDSLTLFWPSTWEECLSTNVFLAVAKNVKETKEVLVKFQKKTNVRSWLNEKDKSTECSASKNLVPMDYFVSKEMIGKPRIPQFFADESNFKGSKTIYLVYHYFKNSMTLNEWFKKESSGKSANKQEIEANLKIYFKQMHEALVMLKKKNYIYTDFKPENVLINLNNKKGSSFLMNLGNVATLNNGLINQVCMASNEYFPPIEDSDKNSDKKKMIASYLKQNENKPDNLLIWTYCSSLMSLVCPEFETKKNSHFKNRKIYSGKGLKSKNSLLNLIQCQGANIFKYSTKLHAFLNACLVKDSKIKKFEDIISQDWFKE